MNPKSNVLILTAIKMEHHCVGVACVPNFRDDVLVRPRDPIVIPSGWEVSIAQIGIKAIGLPAVKVPADCKLIIMAGLAGGLDPALRIGDAVVSGIPSWLIISEAILRREMVTTDRAITTVAAKADLHAKTSAAAVDMETSIVRAWATEKGIDCVAIRTISDTATDAVDPRVMNLVDGYGRTRPTHVGSYILKNPLRIGSLMKLGKNSQIAALNLAKAVRSVLELLPAR